MGCILVIEDEADIRELVHDVLEAEGYSVVTIARSDEVERVVGRVHPDLVLTNVMLHGKSGIDIALDLRAQGYKETPFIAMSASTTMARFAQQSGLFQATLDKPFDLERLLDLVTELVPVVPTDTRV